jgi:hypothetical protein
VFRQHAVNNVLVDVDPERARDDARNPRTTESRITRLELDDGLDECIARPFRAGRRPAPARREQSTVLVASAMPLRGHMHRACTADAILQQLEDHSITDAQVVDRCPIAQICPMEVDLAIIRCANESVALTNEQLCDTAEGDLTVWLQWSLPGGSVCTYYRSNRAIEILAHDVRDLVRPSFVSTE